MQDKTEIPRETKINFVHLPVSFGSLVQMFPPVITKNPAAVEFEVQAAYLGQFPQGDPLFVRRAFGWAVECFTGKYKDYQAIDARYHDFEHTLQGTLCMGRLLRGRFLARAEPLMTDRMFRLGLLAILLHDTGYLKKRDDQEGTGAKYTVTHVERSAEFASALMEDKGFAPADIRAVQNMIHCTGVDAALSIIPFGDEIERLAGFTLGTADLLGQMAAPDYVDKLPTLFAEFDEAAHFAKGQGHFIAGFSSASDLMSKTPMFWQKYVLVKLERDFGGLFNFLNDPYPDGRNEYIERIEANMNRLRGSMAGSAMQTA